MILTSRSCAIADCVEPKQSYDVESASELKGQLVALARQLAND